MIISPIPNQILQQATFHLGVVRDVKDPEKRGRVRVEVPSIWGQGERCWSYWADVCAFPVGSSYKDGDHGIWWCPVPGERVLVGFIAGQHQGAFVIPGPIWPIDNRPGSEVIPTEVKSINQEDNRQGTRLRVIKSEAGHTILMDDRGTEESMMICDWTGAGIGWYAPGKQKDIPEQDGEPSYARGAEIRGGDTVFSGSNKSASQISKIGITLCSLLGTNGSGMIIACKDGQDKVTMFACQDKGDPGPSIVLDAKDDLVIFTTGKGNVQLVLDGKNGVIRTSRQIIKEIQPTPMKDFIKSLLGIFKAKFEQYIHGKNQDLGQLNPKPEVTV